MLKKRLLVAFLVWLILAICLSGAQAAEKQLLFLGAKATGAWYPMAGAWANVVTKLVPGYEASASTSAGSVDNVRSLKERSADMAIVQPDVLYYAYNGEGRYKGKKVDILRSLFSTYSAKVQIVTLANSPIKAISDFRGKRVGVGAPGSGTETIARALLKFFGMTYNDIKAQFILTDEQLSALKDGHLDVAIIPGPIPHSGILDVMTRREIRFVNIEQDKLEQLVSEVPGYYTDYIKAGSYKGLDHDISAIAFRGTFTATTRMSESEVYQILKAIWDNPDMWKGAHAKMEDVNLETALLGMQIPLHLGAVKFYQEQGMDIPDKLLPPEYK